MEGLKDASCSTATCMSPGLAVSRNQIPLAQLLASLSFVKAQAYPIEHIVLLQQGVSQVTAAACETGWDANIHLITPVTF